MREAKRPDYYTLLGLSSKATPEEIKRRYRKLVRRYHPDVRPDKEVAHQQFVQLVEAYQTLSDPERRQAYDAALRHLGPSSVPGPAGAAGRPRPAEASRSAWRSQIEALLSMAERSLAQGDYAAAIEKCKKIMALDPQHARAHALWGDACLEQGEFEQAILLYSLAVQFDPHSILYGEKLQQAIREEQIAAFRQQRFSARPGLEPAARKGRRAVPFQPYLNASLVLIALALVGWAVRQPGPVLSERLPIPLHVALSAVGIGGLVGMLLALKGWLGPFDEELIYATVQERVGGGTPLGLLLGIASLVWIYFGLLVYCVIVLVNESLSRSILLAFGVTFLIVGMAALLAPQAWKPILLFGGNFVFIAVVLGWLVGNVGQNSW